MRGQAVALVGLRSSFVRLARGSARTWAHCHSTRNGKEDSGLVAWQPTAALARSDRRDDASWSDRHRKRNRTVPRPTNRRGSLRPRPPCSYEAARTCQRAGNPRVVRRAKGQDKPTSWKRGWRSVALGDLPLASEPSKQLAVAAAVDERRQRSPSQEQVPPEKAQEEA